MALRIKNRKWRTATTLKNGALRKAKRVGKLNFNKMKNVFIIATFISAFAIMTAFTSSNIKNSVNTEVTYKSDFCKGWEEGYCEGWKDVKGQYAICPITPICPIPEIGQDTFKGGYNRGFKAGRKKALEN
jgi:hypothetical protein